MQIHPRFADKFSTKFLGFTKKRFRNLAPGGRCTGRPRSNSARVSASEHPSNEQVRSVSQGACVKSGRPGRRSGLIPSSAEEQRAAKRSSVRGSRGTDLPDLAGENKEQVNGAHELTLVAGDARRRLEAFDRRWGPRNDHADHSGAGSTAGPLTAYSKELDSSGTLDRSKVLPGLNSLSWTCSVPRNGARRNRGSDLLPAPPHPHLAQTEPFVRGSRCRTARKFAYFV